MTTHYILCDGAELARFWARVGSDKNEKLIWVPRNKESRARPAGFRALPGGLSSGAFKRMSLKEEQSVAIVSEDLSFIRTAIGALREASPNCPVLVMSDKIDLEGLSGHDCIRHTGLRSQIRDDVYREFHHLSNLSWVVKIRNLLSTRERIGILLQSDPDPDGIASGYGLRALLGRKAPTAPVISFGAVKRPENRAMVEALGLDVRTIRPQELDEFDGLALIDVQPTVFGEDPPERVRNVDVVIDHHPERTGYTASLKDIRPSYGATATIITEYVRAARSDIGTKLATALLYGVKSDTQLLGRDTSSADMEAFAFLHSCHSPAQLRRIERPALSRTALRAFGRALAQTEIEDGIHLLFLGRVREDVIPQVAELGLQAEGAEWAIAAGIVKSDLIFSVRNVGYVRAAGEAVRAVVEGLGIGGGHRSMAKGSVPLRSFREVYGKTDRQTIRNALLEAFKRAISGEENKASLLIGPNNR